MKRNQLLLICLFIFTSIYLFGEDLEFQLVKGNLGLDIVRSMFNKSDQEIIAPFFVRIGKEIVIILINEKGAINSNWQNLKKLRDDATTRWRSQTYFPKHVTLRGFWGLGGSQRTSINENGKYYVLGLMKILIDEKSKKSILKRSNILHVSFRNGKIAEAVEIKKESLPKNISAAVEKKIAQVMLDEGL